MGINFVVESMRHCFLCLNKIPSPLEDEPESELSSAALTFSIQYLSRYLRVDIGTVFHEMEAVPSHLLGKVKQSKLKVELCEGCSLLNANFSKLYRQLEKIQMEVGASLELISRRLAKVETTDQIEEMKMFVDSLPNKEKDAYKGKLGILEGLRTEVVNKCSSKLGGNPPQVKLQNLSMKDCTHLEKLKVRIANYRYTDDQCSQPIISYIEKIETTSNTGYVKEDSMTYGNEGSIVNSNMDSEDDSVGFSGIEEVAREGNHEQPTSTYSFEVIAPEGSSLPDHQKFLFDRITRKFRCSQCGVEFKDKATCVRHYGCMHLKLKYRCKLCGKEFKHKSVYYSHHNVIHVGRRFRCDICHADFTEKSALTRHQKFLSCKPRQTLKGNKKFVCRCNICGQGFTFKANLKKHLKELHSEIQKPACKVCGKEFSRERYLKIHEKNKLCKK